MTDSLQKCKEVAAAMLGRRALSEHELGSKLEEKGYEEADIHATLSYLRDYGYVDDAKYALSFAQTRHGRGQGSYRIRQELRQRGVDEEIIEDVLTQLPEPDDAIQKILRSKLGKVNDEDTRRKAAAALSRRGFSWDEINAGISHWE
ncbi:MAG: recombination regulator RecX [Oscillospiraceae bacterium]|nr:recombination regulator RecX [Oscillospiraceae bacterium]